MALLGWDNGTARGVASGSAPLPRGRDRAKIREPYAPDWKLWFGEEGDPPGAVFLELDEPQPVVLFELVKGWLTGEEPELGETHRIG